MTHTQYPTMESQYQQMPYYTSPQDQMMYAQPEHQVVYQQGGPQIYQADPNSQYVAAQYTHPNQYAAATHPQYAELDAQQALAIQQQQYVQQLHAIQNSQMQARNANYQVVMQYADGSTTTAIVPEQYLQQYCQSANTNIEAAKAPQNYPPVKNQYPPVNASRNSSVDTLESEDCVKKPVRQLSEVGSETGVNEGRVTPPYEMDCSPSPSKRKLEDREYTLTPENVPVVVTHNKPTVVIQNQVASPISPAVANPNQFAHVYADPNHHARAAMNHYHATMSPAQNNNHLTAPHHFAAIQNRNQYHQPATNQTQNHLHNQRYTQLRHPALFVAQNAAFMGSEALKKKTKRRRQSREEARRARRAPRFQLPEDIPPMEIANLRSLGEKFNLKPEQLKTFSPAHAKFVIIKSFHEDDVHKAVKFGLWSSTPHGNEKLQKVYEDAHTEAIQLSRDGSGLDANGNPICPIFLFFSVNKSKGFCGVARMAGPVDFDKKVDWWVRKNDGRNKWRGAIKVEWVSVKDVPNTIFQDLCFPGFTHRPLIFSRDTTELPSVEGNEFLRRYIEFKSQTTLLQDMAFYDEEYEEFLKNGGNKSDFEASTNASSVAGSDVSKPVTPESGEIPAKTTAIHTPASFTNPVQKVAVPIIRQPTYAQKVAGAHSNTTTSNNWAQLVAKSPPGLQSKKLVGGQAFKPLMPIRKNSGFGRAVQPTA